ncbi:MAG: succinylglutamate desuccinylase/aspartoacylase family protein [Deltaproteobacteria bacterium]|nr:succinylglutamate desuccinylase/aspartoacylase family protein [Deltaproteobacteria bacterium]
MMQTDKKLLSKKQKANGQMDIENYRPTDPVRFTQRLYQLASKRGFLVQKLGNTGSDPIILVTPKELNSGPNLLIAAGFHGDEPAGCWGILHFLETVSPDLLSKSNLSFLPLVNPSGFRHGKRTNDGGENPNSGFCHTNSGQPEPSREGLILVKHLPMLKSLAKDGFLSLHEDIELEQFYIYTFENADVPGPFSEALRAEAAKFTEPYPDGRLEGGLVCNGIIFVIVMALLKTSYFTRVYQEQLVLKLRVCSILTDGLKRTWA